MKSDERTNQSQYRVLVGFLERNVNLAKGIEANSARGREIAKEKWEHITLTLNAVGPPVKDAIKWKAVSLYLTHIFMQRCTYINNLTRFFGRVV